MIELLPIAAFVVLLAAFMVAKFFKCMAQNKHLRKVNAKQEIELHDLRELLLQIDSGDVDMDHLLAEVHATHDQRQLLASLRYDSERG